MLSKTMRRPLPLQSGKPSKPGANVKRRWPDPSEWIVYTSMLPSRSASKAITPLRADEPAPESPAGVELVALAERPDLFRRTYEELALQVFEDIPTPTRITISAEDWERDWITWPEGSVVALAEGEIVGCAGLLRDPDRPDRAENSLTAVRRDWRGRGLATALKQAVIAWAAASGLLEIYTWTQTGNEAMQRLNEKLGYRSRMIAITMRGPIPTVR